MQLEDLPKLDNREEVRAFAASFNGYSHFGSFTASADAANAQSRATLEDLRNELFFSYRASNHCGTDDFLITYEELLPYFEKLLRSK